MASVTQCDVCNNVVKHEESKYISIYNVCRDDSRGRNIAQKELCSECYKKVSKVLNINEEEN